ncbi:MAG TPA: prephenate dehydratase [Planctomycetes bacterium]|nr:prephenate dehydratase [Fuerstiella sp.]HIK90766.1 prephenate dehydratase [Planctomycetota bacterium]
MAKKKAAKPVKKKVAKKRAPAASPTRATKPTKARSVPVPANPDQELAAIDQELVGLLNRRVETFLKKVAQSESPQETLFDVQDDIKLWTMLESMNKGPLSTVELKSVFRSVISAGRQRVKNTRVAYLGPAYSFTHLAAINRFGESADLVPVSTIATVFEEVNRGHVQYGLVPIENSTDGRIVDTLDMFTRLPLRICGEIQLHVHHNLLARCDWSDITEIYSKPQALSQCRDWLAKNMSHARLIEVTSTSTAAQLARDKPGAAAVASQQAAVQYGIQIVAECIEDNRNNMTRFAIIGDSIAEPTGHDRTAILLQIPHKSGSLSDALQVFKKCKVNLTWIESFPLRSPEIGYLFFLDFEGHVTDAKTKRTLKELESMADRLEILGSYPRSEPLN